MKSLFESDELKESTSFMVEYAGRLTILFPQLEWDLKKAGYSIEPPEFLSLVIYLSVLSLVLLTVIIGVPLLVLVGVDKLYITLVSALFLSSAVFLYLMLLPKTMIKKRARDIDKDLEYMLKDIRIQLSSGVPLFDTLVNASHGKYGQCSEIAQGIVEEVESGKSMVDVLDKVGLWSPSDHLRNVLWQIVNAVKSGSDINRVLEAISQDIRIEKENRIKSYAQELNMWGLVYMMFAIVAPSMGVTLLLILSSFMGMSLVTERLFWFILAGLILFQVFFITYVRSRRPDI